MTATATLKLSVLTTLTLSSVLFGQQEKTQGGVGINTDKPHATLEVKTFDETGNSVEGVLIPRVTAARAENMGTNVAEGTLLYITDGTAGTNTTSQVNRKGFYYFDTATNKWTKLGGSSNTINATNGLTLSSGNVKLGGTLTETTTINQNNKEITFTTGTTGKLNVNGNLYLQNRVYVKPNIDNGAPNGLASTSTPGTNLRNYNGTGVPDYNDNDYMIVLTNAGINGNLQLPSASAYIGRIIYLINGTATGLGFSGANYDATSDIYPFNFTTLATRSGVSFVSTGKTWYPIGR